MVPSHVTEKILNMAHLDIDTRIALKMKPAKIDNRCFERLFLFRKMFIYNEETQSLHSFLHSGYHLIRRPIHLDYCDQNISVFNDNNDTFWFEVTAPDGKYVILSNHHETVYVMTNLIRFCTENTPINEDSV